MTKSELIKKIEWYMESAGAMICIENLGIRIKEYPYYMYGIEHFKGVTFFTSDYGKGNLICPVKWDRFKKTDLQGIYERIESTTPKIYSKKDGADYAFYKIWL